AFREQIGPVVPDLHPGMIDVSKFPRIPPGGGHSQDTAARSGEKDCTIAAPRTASAGPRFADDLRRSTRDINSFELVIGEEGDRAAVRRPEWKIAILCARQRLQTQ